MIFPFRFQLADTPGLKGGMSIGLVCLALLLGVGPAEAGRSAEEKCQRALMLAAAKFRFCMDKELSRYFGYGGHDAEQSTFGKKTLRCVVKYTTSWEQLVEKYEGEPSSCSGERFVDNGDGTFTDRLTRLTWATKTDVAGEHDVENTYSYSTGAPWLADGSAFSDYLATLNASALGGGQGWRVAAVEEVFTLIDPSAPTCGSGWCTRMPGAAPSAVRTFATASTHPDNTDLHWVISFSAMVAASSRKDYTERYIAVTGGN